MSYDTKNYRLHCIRVSLYACDMNLEEAVSLAVESYEKAVRRTAWPGEVEDIRNQGIDIVEEVCFQGEVEKRKALQKGAAYYLKVKNGRGI